MKCKQVSRQLLAYLDGEVTDRQRSEIEAHLDGCPACSAELEELGVLQVDLSTLVKAAGEEIDFPPASEARVAAHLSAHVDRIQSADLLAILRGWLGRGSWLVSRALVVLLLVAFVAAVLLVNHPPQLAQPTLPELDLQETVLLSQANFAPGSLAAIRVLVRQMPGGTPVAQAEVTVSLAPQDQGDQAVELFAGRTDDTGTLPVSFWVPDDLDEGGYTLVVETRSEVGSDRVERAITLQRSYRLLLSVDKPLYQPGQVIHMRALALSTVDRRAAAGQPIVFTVEDPRENKLLRQQVVASEYGLAALDFSLSDEAEEGRYRLSVTVGDTTSERIVTVGPYVLPKFRIQIETDRSYYLPGGRVEGHVQTDYFFGKPVSLGHVELRGVVYDVERSEEVSIQGKTDEEGRFAFAFALPAYFAGGMLESGVAHFGLEVSVTDQAEHTESSSRMLPVSDRVILVEAVAESGQLKPGVENIIYLLASYPDGSPAEADLSVTYGRETIERRTGAYGLAEIRVVPGEGKAHRLIVDARDAEGNQTSRDLTLSGVFGSDHLLLRPERAIYQVGQTLAAEVLTSRPEGTVYLDLVREGQTMQTQAAALEEGRAVLALDLTPDLAGTLELHAYQVRADGTIVRDTRLVVVDAPVELSVEASADRVLYRPGDTAQVTFDVAGQDGRGVQAALGVGVVDESVYALQELDPGFAKVYFLLEKILQEPRYQIKGFSWSSLVGDPPPDQAPSLAEAQNASAAAALADTPDRAFDLQAFTYAAKAQEVERANRDWEVQVRRHQATWIGRARWVTGLALVTVPLLLAGIVLWDLRRQRRSLQPVAWVAGLLLLLSPTVLFGSSILIELIDWPRELAISLLWGQMRWPQALAFVLFWAPLEFGALILLAMEAWRKRVQSLKFAVPSMAVYLVVLGIISVMQLGLGFGTSLTVGVGLNLALVVGTLLLVALWRKSRGRSVLVVAPIVGLIIMACATAWIAMYATFLRPGDTFNPFPLGSSDPVPQAPRQAVLVARSPIAAGSVIRIDMVTFQERDNIPPGAATQPRDVEGLTALRNIAQGEVILLQELSAPRLEGAGLRPGPTWTPTPTPTLTPSPTSKPGQTPQPGDEVGVTPPEEEATPEPPRLREWFPETLYWNPEAVTDEDGHLVLPVPLSDSITTWRLSALANSQDGRLGGATIPLGVFQDFFVDLDLPVALTQHDEIAVPVAVYNYLPVPQTLRLEMDPAPWFELLGPPVQEITLGPTDIDVVYFRIRALEHGQQKLTVMAFGTEMSDAISRELRVEPDGKRYRDASGDWLEDGEEQVLVIPDGAIPGASRIEVKVYPGPVSHVVEGLERILRMPFG